MARETSSGTGKASLSVLHPQVDPLPARPTAALGGQPVGPGLGGVVETVQPDDGGLARATLEWLEDEAGC